jgi:hypothetical protein
MSFKHFLISVSLICVLGILPTLSDSNGLATTETGPATAETMNDATIVRKQDIREIRRSKFKVPDNPASNVEFIDEFDFPFDSASLNDQLMETASREVHFGGETLTRSALDEVLESALNDSTPRL